MDKEAIVLVHGLWVNGMDMSLLRYRLGQKGYRVYQFSYSSVLEEPARNAEILQQFIQSIEEEVIHFVCHSLGGLVIRHYLANEMSVCTGRVVTLGTPHQQSTAAQQLNRVLPGRLLLGKSIQHGLLGNVPGWCRDIELGSVAGTLRLGLGMILPDIPRPNDGTVAVAETWLKNMADHIIVPASHFGMLLSYRVANLVDTFLQKGQFCYRSEDNK